MKYKIKTDTKTYFLTEEFSLILIEGAKTFVELILDLEGSEKLELEEIGNE